MRFLIFRSIAVSLGFYNKPGTSNFFLIFFEVFRIFFGCILGCGFFGDFF